MILLLNIAAEFANLEAGVDLSIFSSIVLSYSPPSWSSDLISFSNKEKTKQLSCPSCESFSKVNIDALGLYIFML